MKRGAYRVVDIRSDGVNVRVTDNFGENKWITPKQAKERAEAIADFPEGSHVREQAAQLLAAVNECHKNQFGTVSEQTIAMAKKLLQNRSPRISMRR